jgi:hypothetical protein
MALSLAAFTTFTAFTFIPLFSTFTALTAFFSRGTGFFYSRGGSFGGLTSVLRPTSGEGSD